MEEVRKVSTTTNNNLNSIKFIAALLVIFSHAFPISLGPGKFDPIYYLTNTQISLGNFSVCIFFIIGGYLICSSVNRTPKFKDFFRKRVLRIFPLLLVVLFLTTFVIGPFITSLSIKDYFLNVDTYIYFFRNSLMITSHHLPGAFSDNVYNLSPNGSLWTLPIEFLCYIGCYMTYKLNLLDLKKAKPLFLLLVLVTLSQKIIASFLPITAEVLPLILLFSVGMLYYLYKDSIPLKPSIAFVCLILIIMSIFFNFYYITKILLLPYLIFYLSFGVKIKLPILDNLSKLAYGIYLWGFFVQQVVCYIFGGSMNPIINILISMPIAIVLSYLVTKFFDLRKKK